MYREIGDAPEHVSFSHHQTAYWRPVKATLHDAKSLTYKVPLLARYIEHTPYGPEDMANCQPSGCQSTMIA